LLVVFAAVLALFHQAEAGIVLQTLPPDTRPEHCRNIPLKHGCVCPTDFNPVGLNGCQFGNICERNCAHPDWVEKWAKE
ncbi:hypothetical protein ABMA28_016789, partial [Loxostege sticticalis]